MRPDRAPRPGEPIRAPFLAWVAAQLRRQRIRPAAPLFARETEGGTILGIRSESLALAYSTSVITAATYSGSAITAFGSGTADLYDLAIASVGGARQAAPNADKGVSVSSVGTSTIAADSVLLLGHPFGEAAGYFVLGRVC